MPRVNAAKRDKVIAALAGGATQSQAAVLAEVSERVIRNWLRHDAAFVRELAERRESLLQANFDATVQLQGTFLDSLGLDLRTYRALREKITRKVAGELDKDDPFDLSAGLVFWSRLGTMLRRVPLPQPGRVPQLSDASGVDDYETVSEADALTVIADAVRPFPEAAAAVADALLDLEEATAGPGSEEVG